MAMYRVTYTITAVRTIEAGSYSAAEDDAHDHIPYPDVEGGDWDNADCTSINIEVV